MMCVLFLVLLLAGPAAAEEWELVFYSDRTGGGDLHRWSDGGALRLTTHPAAEYNPRLAGNRLVYLCESVEPVAVTSLSGDVLFPNPGFEEPPAWSPDGAWIVYPARRDGNVDLYLASVGDGSERRLTTHPDDDVEPAFSPDGRNVIFSRDVDGQRDLHLLRLEDGSVENLTQTLEVNEGHPFVENGGFVLFDADDTEDGLPDIFRLNLDSGERTNVSRSPGVDLIARSRPGDGRIAFGSSRSGNWEIWLMEADGSRARRLTDAPGFDGDPIWVPSTVFVDQD